MKKSVFLAICMIAVVAVLAAGCVSPAADQTPVRQTVSLANTIGPVDAGMIPALEKAYMDKYPTSPSVTTRPERVQP